MNEKNDVAALMERFGTSDPETIVATFDSVVEQLESLYSEREAMMNAGIDPETAPATFTSLIEQLHAIYADGDADTSAAVAA